MVVQSMIYVFVPYYNEDTPEFKKSLRRQTVRFTLIKRDTKRDKILWTEAVNDFWHDSFNWGKDDDVICIMNNDIEFDERLFIEGGEATSGWVHIPYGCEMLVDWSKKRFSLNTGVCDSFIGRCFFMTLKDFKERKFCKLLPHAFSDLDFGLRTIKSGIVPILISPIIHKEHGHPKVNCFSKLSYKNPIAWTVFLLRHPNRYTLINILKAWYDIFRGKNNLVSTNRR